MSSADDRRAIEELTSTVLRGVNANDIDQIISVWAEDGVLMPPNHPAVHGRAAIDAYFRKLWQGMRFQFTFTETPLFIDGDTAIQRISYTVQIWLAGAKEPIADRGKGVHVYVRTSGGWKLRLDVWNSDSPRVPS